MLVIYISGPIYYGVSYHPTKQQYSSTDTAAVYITVPNWKAGLDGISLKSAFQWFSTIGGHGLLRLRVLEPRPVGWGGCTHCHAWP